jgi:flavin-dependent dehydrogenase
LRTRFGATQTHSERLLVVGDAAETISPLSGEGIAPAMLSGEIAAAHAIDAFQKGDFSASLLSGYSTALERQFARDYRHAAILRKALKLPWLLNRVFHNMNRDPDLALLVGAIIIGQYPPGMALKPVTLMKLLK